MSSSEARLDAVIAALERVSEHVGSLEEDIEVECSTYNRWIEMLDGVVEGNWKSLMLKTEVEPARDMQMHVEAAIAFLEAHRDAIDDED